MKLIIFIAKQYSDNNCNCQTFIDINAVWPPSNFFFYFHELRTMVQPEFLGQTSFKSYKFLKVGLVRDFA